MIVIMMVMMMTDVMFCYYIHKCKFLTCEGSSLSVTCTEIDDGGVVYHWRKSLCVVASSIDGRASIALGQHQVLSAGADSRRSHQSLGQRLASIALRGPPYQCLASAHRRHH
jgi:hypothetical protein